MRPENQILKVPVIKLEKKVPVLSDSINRKDRKKVILTFFHVLIKLGYFYK